ncbi:MAG: exosortase/archaeosortase family protein [Limisphaerales bacterium]
MSTRPQEAPSARHPTPATDHVLEPPPGGDASGTVRRRIRPVSEVFGPHGRRFLLTAAIVTLVFANPWVALFRGAMADALYSYAVLIPYVSIWLIWQIHGTPGPKGSRPAPAAGILLLFAAAACAAGGILARRSGWIVSPASWLTTQIGAWVIAIWGTAFLHLGGTWIRERVFALAFLSFTVPFPDPVVAAIEAGLQSASATASDWLFSLSGTPYLRDEMVFWLPNIRINVAPECSGIRSTLVLVITGILGAHLLLARWYHRLAVVAVILPLGVFRNALRILTLTLLSVHVDPGIMNSALHKRGGPLFFAVSLIPLFLMFWWFGRRERKQRRAP